MRVEISVLNITPLKMIEERCIYYLFINQNKKKLYTITKYFPKESEFAKSLLLLFNIYTELQYGII